MNVNVNYLLLPNRKVLERYNFAAESMSWFVYHNSRTEIQKPTDVSNESEIFYPSVFSVICIGLSIPATTCIPK